MTAPKQVDYTTGTVVSADWLDRMQEVEAGLRWNCELQWPGGSSTTITVAAGAGSNAGSINIAGHMRYVETPLSITFANHTQTTTGVYNIWATTGSDDTDPAWALEARTVAASTPTTAYYRQIGVVSWNATTSLFAYVSDYPVKKHGHTHMTGGQDPLPAGVVETTTLADGSVTTPKIADLNVTTGKIADNAVTAAKIPNGSITKAKLAAAPFVVLSWVPYQTAGSANAWTNVANNPTVDLTIPAAGWLEVRLNCIWRINGVFGFFRFVPMDSGGTIDTSISNYDQHDRFLTMHHPAAADSNLSFRTVQEAYWYIPTARSMKVAAQYWHGGGPGSGAQWVNDPLGVGIATRRYPAIVRYTPDV